MWTIISNGMAYQSFGSTGKGGGGWSLLFYNNYANATRLVVSEVTVCIFCRTLRYILSISMPFFKRIL